MITAPTVGRMVYYRHQEVSGDLTFTKNRPAVITDVREVDASGQNEGVGGGAHQVKLFVMMNDRTMFTDWISQGQEAEQWDWMPFQKDQMARLAPGTANDSHVAVGSGGSTQNSTGGSATIL